MDERLTTSLVSILLLVVGLAFMLDLGHSRTAFAARLAGQVATSTGAAPQGAVSNAATGPAADTFDYQGRSYVLSTTRVDRSLLGAAIARGAVSGGRTVTIRPVRGLNPDQTFAMLVVESPPRGRPDVWYLAAVQPSLSP